MKKRQKQIPVVRLLSLRLYQWETMKKNGLNFFLKTLRCNIQSKKFCKKKCFLDTLKFGQTPNSVEIFVLRCPSKF